MKVIITTVDGHKFSYAKIDSIVFGKQFVSIKGEYYFEIDEMTLGGSTIFDKFWSEGKGSIKSIEWSE